MLKTKYLRLGVATCLLLLTFACGIEKDKVIDHDQPRFKTTDASRLFFKNTRQIYYDKEEIGRDRLELYRKKTRTEVETDSTLNIILANNWMYDEAYIRFENTALFSPPFPIQIHWEGNNEKGTYTLEDNTKEEHYKLATQIYRGILKEQQFFVKIEDKLVPILSQSNARETFRITMIDFYRLVNLM